ncbi:phosphatidate cytidylyltransferase [Microbacterium gallinarum]|jgi:phosphatidate cytidylyltransferase|uniref:Phosphatidate cytidylyltransferase n=1 Tax=Microbacterium gallinarum TaxID=2762209 RepID=A0ABR8X6I3_9MICO|nr:phosphatidate cytidylyltransferase [Microbacterium gallinarum]MBD8024491.1 phosphatidate cytidylyltransferase [Microbacterium gallinarum]
MSDAPGGPAGGDSSLPAAPLTRREAAEARRDTETDVAAPAAPAPGEAVASESAESGPVSPSHPRAKRSEFETQVAHARAEFETQVAHARAEFEEANERIKARTGRDLILATLIGVAAGAVLIGSLIFVKQLFVVFALAAVLLGVFEFSRALVAAGRKIDLVPQLVAGGIIVVSGYFLELWLHWVVVFVAIALVVVWRLLAQMTARDGRTYGAVLGDVLIGGFIQLYVPFLASLCVVLLAQDGGEWWVLAFIAVVVAADTGAYAAGIMFGKHPMAPRISPKKTWEGFAGAVVAVIIAGVLLGIFMLGLNWWAGIIIGVVILGTATAGDLGESMIKRDLGIKDMSSWLPGHGGVLDRLDSILPSAAAALALYYLFSPLVAS